MKIQQTYLFLLLLPLSCFAGIFQVDGWSFTTSRQGSSVGQMLTWKPSEEQADVLRDEYSKGFSPDSLSKTAEKNIRNYLKEQIAIYNHYTERTESVDAYHLSSFGVKQLYFDDQALTPFAATNKWIRFLNYSVGPDIFSIKVYLLGDDKVLLPIVKELNE